MHKCAHVGVGMVSCGGAQANFVTLCEETLRRSCCSMYIFHKQTKKKRKRKKLKISKEFVCLVEKYNDFFLITL